VLSPSAHEAGAGPRPRGDPHRPVHLADEAGAARMVDVTAKTPTVRTASAGAFVSCSPPIVAALREAPFIGNAIDYMRIEGK